MELFGSVGKAWPNLKQVKDMRGWYFVYRPFVSGKVIHIARTESSFREKNPRKLLAPGFEAIKATVKKKMELFGSVGKALTEPETSKGYERMVLCVPSFCFRESNSYRSEQNPVSVKKSA